MEFQTLLLKRSSPSLGAVGLAESFTRSVCLVFNTRPVRPRIGAFYQKPCGTMCPEDVPTSWAGVPFASQVREMQSFLDQEWVSPDSVGVILGTEQYLRELTDPNADKLWRPWPSICYHCNH
jgi:hypothetical protein